MSTNRRRALPSATSAAVLRDVGVVRVWGMLLPRMHPIVLVYDVACALGVEHPDGALLSPEDEARNQVLVRDTRWSLVALPVAALVFLALWAL